MEVLILESILNSTKKLLGITEEQTAFDTDIVVAINTALSALSQIGVGSDTGYSIQDSTNTWSEFIGDRKDLEAVKSYVYLKTRLMFDPPQSSAVADAIKTNLSEIEWRISSAVDWK